LPANNCGHEDNGAEPKADHENGQRQPARQVMPSPLYTIRCRPCVAGGSSLLIHAHSRDDADIVAADGRGITIVLTTTLRAVAGAVSVHDPPRV
jgi:hypothetical protein